MAKSTRRPQHIFTIVMWVLSIIFAAFLIGLGGLLIQDLRKVDKSLTLQSYVDQGALEQIKSEQSQLSQLLKSQQRDMEDARSDFISAQEDYDSARNSLRNWLETRTATEASDQNPDVISRNLEVERLNIIRRERRATLEGLETQIRQTQRQSRDASTQYTSLLNAARPEFNAKKRAREFRVFLFRLALTLPLLLAAGWMAKTKRGSSYWPLYRGFILFALFAFFVELVPYLPSYGGYVRYGVGILMVLVISHFIIKGMRSYVARKQAEEQRSEVERRKSIDYETALKKITAKTCPGCDRSITEREGIETDFCVHCGIRLQEKCTNCGERNISFHRFCLACGVPMPSQENPNTAST